MSVEGLKSQHQIIQIAITNAPFIDEDFRFLENCPNLVNLSVEAVPVNGDLLRWIACPEKVEHLRLDSTLFEDRHLSALGKFTTLASMDLEFDAADWRGLCKAEISAGTVQPKFGWHPIYRIRERTIWHRSDP